MTTEKTGGGGSVRAEMRVGIAGRQQLELDPAMDDGRSEDVLQKVGKPPLVVHS